MTEQEEIQKRYQQIEEFAQQLAEAKKALDIRSWARENGIDIERVLEVARQHYSAADIEAARREAEEQIDHLLRDLGKGAYANALAGSPSPAARRIPRTMV